MLDYLKIMEHKLIDMLSTPTIIRKVNNSNSKSYVHDKLKKELFSEDTRYTEAFLDLIKFKRLEI